MNYNKELIELISDLSTIQTQLIFEDQNDQTFTIKANDKDVTTCFILNAPKSYFDFPGQKIAFYDYSKFKKYFNIFDKPAKDPAMSNTPKLDIETTAQGSGYMLKVSSSIDARCVNNKLGDPATVAQPQFRNIVFPSVDAELSLSAADVADLQSMVNTVSADNIQFNCSDQVCRVTLRNNFSGDTYSTEYALTNPIQVPFEINTPKTGIMALPTESYKVKFCSRGLIELTQLREDDIKLTIYLTRKK